MASNPTLRDFLFGGWCLPFNLYLPYGVPFSDLDELTVTDIAKEHLQLHIAPQAELKLAQENLLAAQGNLPHEVYHGPPSLPTLAIRATIQHCLADENVSDLAENFRTVSRSLPDQVLNRLLEDPKLPYMTLRHFLTSRDQIEGPHRTIVDIDETISRQHRFLQAQHSKHLASKFLVSLEDLSLLGENSDGNFITFSRKKPPPGGLEIFDEIRNPRVKLLPTDSAFIKAFDRETTKTLEGLSWDNVYLAGKLPLRLLMLPNQTDDEPYFEYFPDIELFLYGLSPTEALTKVHEIHDVWQGNLGRRGHPTGMAYRKTVRDISFVSDCTCKVRIHLRTFSNPVAILLDRQTDTTAIGFDGQVVRMLPRCARALETGYNTLRTGYISCQFVDHLDSESPHPLPSIRDFFADAKLGFGLRILPSLCKSLEETISVPMLAGQGSFERRIRKIEPGLKRLARYDWLGNDWVERQLLGKSSTRRYYERLTDQPRVIVQMGEDSTLGQQQNVKILKDDRATVNAINRAVVYEDCHTELMSSHSGNELIGNFELFARKCRVFILQHLGKGKYATEELRKRYSAEEIEIFKAYDVHEIMRWYPHEEDEGLIDEIEGKNNRAFESVKNFICHRVNHPIQHTGWKDYLTRRIRLDHFADHFEALFEKQLVFPVIIPSDLEDHLRQLALTIEADRGIVLPNFLIPIHRAGEGRGLIPDYVEMRAPNIGNLKYWVRSDEMLWRGFDYRLDEMSYILVALHKVFMAYHEEYEPPKDEVDSEFFKDRFGEILRQRTPPDLKDEYCRPEKRALVLSTGGEEPLYPHTAVTAKEAMKFSKWVFQSPQISTSTLSNNGQNSDSFWVEGREDNWGSGDITDLPRWT